MFGLRIISLSVQYTNVDTIKLNRSKVSKYVINVGTCIVFHKSVTHIFKHRQM